MLQIFYPLLDLTIRSQLFADCRHRIFLTPREHIILDKLTCTIGHPQRNGTLFHRHKTPRIDISKDHIIQRIQICFSGWVYTVHIPTSSVIIRILTLIHKLSDLSDRIRCSILCQVIIFRNLAGMAEKMISTHIGIILSYFKRCSDTGRYITSRIQNLQHKLGTEIHILTVGRSILLRTPEVAQHASSVLRVIRRFIQKCRSNTSI